MKPLGIILIIAGIVMMVITGINITKEEKVVDLGKLEINKETTTPVNWSPIIGLFLLASGVGVLLIGKKTA